MGDMDHGEYPLDERRCCSWTWPVGSRKYDEVEHLEMGQGNQTLLAGMAARR